MSEPIASPHNARVAAARALLTRRGRTAASAFLVEGPHAVTELLASDRAVREVFVTDAAADRDVELLRRLSAARVAVHVVTERVLASLGDTVTPQGIVAVAATAGADLGAVLASQPGLVAVLAGVSDPGNAGTAIRTADAAGAAAVVLTAGSVDPHAGKVVRASAGSLFHLPVVAGVAAEGLGDRLRDAGCRVLAAAADGAADLDELADSGGLDGPVAWLFGNEAHGLDPALAEAADLTVRVPIHGKAESLNLAATVAVCLYASARAHRRGASR